MSSVRKTSLFPVFVILSAVPICVGICCAHKSESDHNTVPSSGMVGPEVPLPSPTQRSSSSRDYLRVEFGEKSGAATVVGPRRRDGRWYILTSSSCVGEVGAEGKATIGGGEKIDIEVVVSGWPEGFECRACDKIAWCVTKQDDLSIPYSRISTQDTLPGQKSWAHIDGHVRQGFIVSVGFDGFVLVKMLLFPYEAGTALFDYRTNEIVGLFSHVHDNFDDIGFAWPAEAIRSSFPLEADVWNSKSNNAPVRAADARH